MTVKLKDIEFNPEIVNQALVARHANIKKSLVNMIIHGIRKCPRTPHNITRVRNSIVEIYGSAIKITKKKAA